MLKAETSTTSRVGSRTGDLGAWLLAVRAPTLAAAFVPVGVGTAVAYASGGIRPTVALAALFGALLIQLGSNFANDAYDYEKGADGADRLGPPRAAASGLLTPAQLRYGVAVVFAAATVCGVYLAFASSPLILVVGGVSMVAAVAYTGGPFPLAYHGLGDVFVFVFFGMVAVPGTVFVQTLDVPSLALLGGAAVGALSTNILVVNNLRDIPTDQRANKRTLAVRFGRRFSLWQYATQALLAFGFVGVMAWLQGSLFVLLPFVTLPLAWGLFGQLKRRKGAALNSVLKGTAATLMIFGALLSVGLVLAR